MQAKAAKHDGSDVWHQGLVVRIDGEPSDVVVWGAGRYVFEKGALVCWRRHKPRTHPEYGESYALPHGELIHVRPLQRH